MKTSIDKPIRHIVEEFNKSKYIQTIFSCGGHLKKEVGGQVYILFEMEKKYVGKFLAIAFDKITDEMIESGLKLRLSRVCMNGWPLGKSERLSISFEDNKHIFQIKLARDYFHRLSLKVAARL